MRKWEPYKDGEVLTDGGVRILALLRRGTRMADTWYRIRFMCCHRIVERSHATIRRRIAKRSFDCQACAFRKSAKRNHERQRTKRIISTLYGVTPPPWPVPPSVQTPRHR